MTLRLSAFFEEQIRTIISEYKTAVKCSDRLRRSQRFRKKMQQQDQPSATTRSVPVSAFSQLICSKTEGTKIMLKWICRQRFKSLIKLLTLLAQYCFLILWIQTNAEQSPEILLFSSQKRAAVKTQEKVESASVTKSTSAKVSVPERARRSRSSSPGHSSSEDDSKAASSSAGTKKNLVTAVSSWLC